MSRYLYIKILLYKVLRKIMSIEILQITYLIYFKATVLQMLRKRFECNLNNL